MNPLDFSGPTFLVAYLFFSVGVLGILALFVRPNPVATNTPTEAADLADPYAIALLRQDSAEAIRVALLVLLDRGWLIAEEDKLKLGTAPQSDTSRLEEALLREAEREPLQSVDAFINSPGAHGALRSLSDRLRELGYLETQQAYSERVRTNTIARRAATVALVGLAVTKMVVAISRGHLNIVFLALECCVAVMLANRSAVGKSSSLTPGGHGLVEAAQSVHAGLLARAKSLVPQHDTQDVALLAAVYGLSAVSAETCPFIAVLLPAQIDSSSVMQTNSISIFSGADSCSSDSGSSGCSGGDGGSGCGGCSGN